ncbi:MAG: methyltransferase domain-containing protein [Nitrospinota bacterium]|nr:methyltransferase domain-containing protein [Nitrospinota bacterium]
METKKTKEPQCQIEYDSYLTQGPVKLGAWTSWIWRSDPKHLSFTLARYKFCAKLLDGKKTALEVGCGDAFGVPIVLQSVENVHGIDFEPIVIDEIKALIGKELSKRCSFSVIDFTNKYMDKKFEAAYSLDVLEHIPKENEQKFMDNICKSLHSDGVCIIGTPNIEAWRFANPLSMEGHINLKSAETLKSLMEAHFTNVFIFSMNDEIVHTGYYGMAHYLFGLGVGKKK